MSEFKDNEELQEHIAKLERALENGEIEERKNSHWKEARGDYILVGKEEGWKFRLKPQPIAGWVNVFENYTEGLYCTKDDADYCASGYGRIRTVYVQETTPPEEG